MPEKDIKYRKIISGLVILDPFGLNIFTSFAFRYLYFKRTAYFFPFVLFSLAKCLFVLSETKGIFTKEEKTIHLCRGFHRDAS